MFWGAVHVCRCNLSGRTKRRIFFFTTKLDWLRYSGCLGRREGWNRHTRVASMRVLIAYKGPDLGSLFGFWMFYRSQIRILSVVYPFLSHVSFAATGNVTAFASI